MAETKMEKKTLIMLDYVIGFWALFSLFGVMSAMSFSMTDVQKAIIGLLTMPYLLYSAYCVFNFRKKR